MKRFFTSLITFSLIEATGRHPAIAGVLMLLGVGGGAVGISQLTTPTIVPFIRPTSIRTNRSARRATA
jgi:hypothetical protein